MQPLANYPCCATDPFSNKDNRFVLRISVYKTRLKITRLQCHNTIRDENGRLNVVEAFKPFKLFKSKNKKSREDCLFFADAYRLLSISTITATPAMITMIMPIVAGKKYWSVTDGGGGVGVGVACGASAMFMKVSAYES